MARLGSNTQTELRLKEQWTGFDLTKIGAPAPTIFRRGDLVLISGCITTVAPMKNQAGYDLTIAWVDPNYTPRCESSFLAPTMMSRYEGIHQCGTSCTLWPRGQITINFTKNTNPMVLHLSGLCTLVSHEDPIPIPIHRYEAKDWQMQGTKSRRDDVYATPEERAQVLEAQAERPPGLRRCGGFVFLEGEMLSATYGPISQRIGTLPEGCRPRRELRWLASLLRDTDEHIIDHSVAVTLRPDGTISVQGGKIHQVDAKGVMRVLQQKKKGRLCLDGIRFTLMDGLPIELSASLRRNIGVSKGQKSKVGYLMSGRAGSSAASTATAFCIKQDDVVVLEGHLTWTSANRAPNAKQPLAVLPVGCWPRRREVFFTRGGSDLEERRRVDIDRYGRIFCPEGVSDGRLELTGIIFVAAEHSNIRPRDADWDELKLNYQRNDVNVVSTSFDGHELLEQFVRRTNMHEWRFIEYDLARHASRKMLLPLGQAQLKGDKWDMMNLGKIDDRLWREMKDPLDKKFKISSFQTLLHLSEKMFEQVCDAVGVRGDDRQRLRNKRAQVRKAWSVQRQNLMTYSYLEGIASDIVDQMFEHWDFRAQLQGALVNDFRAPPSIEHLFPQHRGGQERLIKKNIKDSEMAKFEEIRQFFYLYETTGNNMTHCSLMGSADVFTTTGKWHFPDSPHVQRQLFENIAWLFPRQMYLYISERQTSRFPFIEDLDVQCRADWQEWSAGEKMRPPDELLMKPPQRDSNGQVFGDPGELMQRRARAIHMIYPHIDKLKCFVYSASGYNKGKDMLKSSFHLVWPQLIVDADRAPVIRYVTLGVFQKETSKSHSLLQTLQNRLLQLHDSNIWELVFDSTTINARNGLRLPYSDKASMVVDSEEDKRKIAEGLLSKTKAFKKRVKEGRPSVAVGTIEFNFERDAERGGDRLVSAKWTEDKDSHSIADWIGMGTCRRDPNSFPELTSWYLGQEVIEMLPTKPGESFYFDDEMKNSEDGPQGGWVTHKPFPNIRRCSAPLPVRDFVKCFNDALTEEQEALRDENQGDLLKQVVGSWTCVGAGQAIWRTTAMAQTEVKVPDFLWGTQRMYRLTEVVYLQSKGKVIISGPREPVEAILRAVKEFTKPDDNAIMPIYDVKKMEW